MAICSLIIKTTSTVIAETSIYVKAIQILHYILYFMEIMSKLSIKIIALEKLDQLFVSLTSDIISIKYR